MKHFTVEWRQVAGYEGQYFVSNDGRVLSLRYDPPRILIPQDNGQGRLHVALWGAGMKQGKLWKIHRLVAMAFLPDTYFDGALVRHLDGDPTNNLVENLAWGTPVENRADMTRHGRDHNRNKTHCKRGHPFDEENTYWAPRYKNPELKKRVCRRCKRNAGREWMRRDAANKRTGAVA